MSSRRYAVVNALSQIRPCGRGGNAAEKIELFSPPSIRRLTSSFPLRDAKDLLKELQSQNERMFLMTFLIMNTGKTEQELPHLFHR